MDDRLKRRILEMSTRLAVEEKERLEAAGTLVDLERLTVEIGDELTRQLTGLLLTSRAQEAAQQQFHPCPECGRGCPIEELEPLLLPGRRGEMEYSEPQCHCPCCRRAFFPVARTLQRPPRENVTPLVLEKVVWAGANLGSYQQRGVPRRSLGTR